MQAFIFNFVKYLKRKTKTLTFIIKSIYCSDYYYYCYRWQPIGQGNLVSFIIKKHVCNVNSLVRKTGKMTNEKPNNNGHGLFIV